ncbi:RNA-directed DNA polymerase [Tanacetum coccineum]
MGNSKCKVLILFVGINCDDPDFREIWSKCDNGSFHSSQAWMVIWGLTGHFGRDKTMALLREQIYWPKMERDINRLLERCCTCHIAKTHSSNVGRIIAPLVGQFSEEGADQSEQIKELNQSVREQINRHNEQNTDIQIIIVNRLYRERESDEEPDSGSVLFQEGEDEADCSAELEVETTHQQDEGTGR